MRSFESKKPNLYDLSDKEGNTIIIGGSVDIAYLQSEGDATHITPVSGFESTSSPALSDEPTN